MPRKLYRFDGMTFVLEADSPIADSPMCEPFRVGAENRRTIPSD